MVSGDGNVLEPDEEVAAIGSGGSYALAAARALRTRTQQSARVTVLELPTDPKATGASAPEKEIRP